MPLHSDLFQTLNDCHGIKSGESGLRDSIRAFQAGSHTARSFASGRDESERPAAVPAHPAGSRSSHLLLRAERSPMPVFAAVALQVQRRPVVRSLPTGYPSARLVGVGLSDDRGGVITARCGKQQYQTGDARIDSAVLMAATVPFDQAKESNTLPRVVSLHRGSFALPGVGSRV